MAQLGRYRFLVVAVLFHLVYIYRSVGGHACHLAAHSNVVAQH
jgi:hypothetical protein